MGYFYFYLDNQTKKSSKKYKILHDYSSYQDLHISLINLYTVVFYDVIKDALEKLIPKMKNKKRKNTAI